MKRFILRFKGYAAVMTMFHFFLQYVDRESVFYKCQPCPFCDYPESPFGQLLESKTAKNDHIVPPHFDSISTYECSNEQAKLLIRLTGTALKSV